jgi:hypothetical protein
VCVCVQVDLVCYIYRGECVSELCVCVYMYVCVYIYMYMYMHVYVCQICTMYIGTSATCTYNMHNSINIFIRTCMLVIDIGPHNETTNHFIWLQYNVHA